MHYWAEIETSILPRRLGNIFDLVIHANKDNWPREKIMDEIEKIDQEVNHYIKKQLDAKPGLKNRLENFKPQYYDSLKGI